MTGASSRIWTFAAVILMVIVVALGWFLGASPKLTDAARFDAERVSVMAQNDLARITIAQLEADSQQLDDLREQLADLRDEFPIDAQYDVAIEQFLATVLEAGVTLQSISIGEPTITSTEPSDAEQAPVEPVEPTEIAAGTLLRVSTSVSVGGSLPSILDFLTRLQLSPRFTVIASGAFSGGTNADGSTFSFELISYVVTGEPQPGGGATEQAPRPEPTETPTPQPTTEPTATPTAEPTPGSSAPATTPSATPSPSP